MQKLQLFQCDYCGTQYKNEKDCIDCESRHVKPKKIKSSKYVNFKDNQKGYPVSINVEMTDGTIQTYKR